MVSRAVMLGLWRAGAAGNLTVVPSDSSALNRDTFANPLHNNSTKQKFGLIDEN
jgi:hypothetical protein